ncbi:MAG: VWA domain-containing protein [Candidatus Peregrinibacteria bacterium]|nr:VWA domain-containing protein [Candidatus Peregrinibacteria bacterium]
MTIIIVAPIITHPRLESSASADILQSLGSLKIGEMDNFYVAELISEGYITDLNKSVIDQIGEFYVTNITIAKELSEEVLSPVSPNENIGIWYGSELLASKNITPFESAENVFTERQVISGIGGGGEGVTGFSARVFLSSNLRTDYFYFGGYVGEGNLSTIINYEGDMSSAEIELVINNNFDIYVNGVNSGSFSGSIDDFTPVTYNFSTANFVSGENIIEIKGEALHVAGGFIKTIYNSDITYEQPKRYYFPGIEGIINLYDGFYIPGNLTGLSISLHFNNSASTFLTLGNTQVFNDSSNGSVVTITNSTLASLLNYEEMSGTTTPLRFGMGDMDYVSNNTKDIDVFSVTDISGSMAAGCSGTSPWYCCWFSADCSTQEGCDYCGGTYENKIQDAKDANNLFIDMILNTTNNKVGLDAYSTSALDSNYHPLSNDSTSLNSEVESWDADGYTCICCGVNKAVDGILADSNPEKFQSIVIMSDGDANIECSQQGTGNANQDAIQSACDAYEDHGIKVYTIGFGADANVQTLTEMASCGGGSFYSTVDDLEYIYEKIAAELIETAYYEQTIEITGEFFSRLYPDSYIEFNYTEETPPVGLVTTLEKKFSSSDGGTFDIPQNSTVLEANVISYSGPRWTSIININDNNVYNLSSYETDFLRLGDPYSVNIPLSFINDSNVLELETGLSPDNTSTGSISDKIIYTISKDLASYTSVSATADGCNWTIQFNDYSMSMSIPSDYSGSETCNYGNSSTGGIYCDIYSDCEGSTDAMQIATYNLLKLLDFDSNGKLDVDLSSGDVNVSSSNLEGVPFLFSTEVQIRKWY